MRKTHAALRNGEVQWLHNSDESRVVSFTRRDASETLVVAINLSPQPFVGVVEAGAGAYADMTSDKAASLPAVALGAWEFRVFRKQQ